MRYSDREADKHYMIGALGALLRHAETIVQEDRCGVSCDVSEACMRCAYLEILEGVTLALRGDEAHGAHAVEDLFGRLRLYSDAVMARERVALRNSRRTL